ncbi:hypothetical protein [Micromonospora sp. NBC_00617]|uniref:hypothetical protein n=1 Tax=Micromonospora sp. NBC_00617 TaxID=2903587 RepID=UPI0030E0B4DE
MTYRDQQQINRAQLDLTRLKRQRYDQRFASRVAAWQVRRAPTSPKDPVDVRVQNRSPVPIKRLYIEARSEDEPEWRDGPWTFEASVDVPPCSLLTFRLHGTLNGRLLAVPMMRISVVLWFVDPVGYWQVGAHGVVPAQADDFTALPKRGRGGNASTTVGFTATGNGATPASNLTCTGPQGGGSARRRRAREPPGHAASKRPAGAPSAGSPPVSRRERLGAPGPAPRSPGTGYVTR